MKLSWVFLVVLFCGLSFAAERSLIAQLIDERTRALIGTVTIKPGPIDTAGSDFLLDSALPSVVQAKYGIAVMGSLASRSILSLQNETLGCYPNSNRWSGVLGDITPASSRLQARLYSDKLSCYGNSRTFLVGRTIAILNPFNCSIPTNSNVTANNTGFTILARGVIAYSYLSDTSSPVNDIFPATKNTQLLCQAIPLPIVGASNISGYVAFQLASNSIPFAILNVSGLEKNAAYSTAIYTYPATDARGYLTGPYFDTKEDTPHGCRGISSTYRLGDMGTFHTDSSGRLTAVLAMPGISLSTTNPASIVGRALLLKSGNDNCIDNPNDDNRIAQCIIGTSDFTRLLPNVITIPSASSVLTFAPLLFLSFLLAFLF